MFYPRIDSHLFPGCYPVQELWPTVLRLGQIVFPFHILNGYALINTYCNQQQQLQLTFNYELTRGVVGVIRSVINKIQKIQHFLDKF